MPKRRIADRNGEEPEAVAALRAGHAALRAGMPLSQAPTGEWVEVLSVQGGRGFLQRVADMGIGPGSRLQISARSRFGPFVVWAKGARLLLGHGMVKRIVVQRLAEERPV
jgi:Fe2+ transport system protein FeoA